VTDYETHIGHFCVSSFEDLCDNITRISEKDQKDLAEDILTRLEEKGWEVQWASPNLICVKTEEL